MAAFERILLTPEGKAERERELDHLRKVELPLMNQRILELSEGGDVSDDSDFEATKEEFVQLQARIRDIEILLDEAEIVTDLPSEGLIGFGSTVTVIDDIGEEVTWVIVGPQEANAPVGRISIASPVGSALVGKRAGEKVTVTAPGGEVVFEVKEIR